MVKHTLNVLCINLYNKVPSPNDIDVNLFQSTKQAEEFELGLRIPRFALIEGDRAKMTGIMNFVGANLREDIPTGDGAGVNSKNDWVGGVIFKWLESSSMKNSILKSIHGLKLFYIKMEGHILLHQSHQRSRDSSEILDEDPKDTASTKEGMNFCKTSGGRPRMNLADV